MNNRTEQKPAQKGSNTTPPPGNPANPADFDPNIVSIDGQSFEVCQIPLEVDDSTQTRCYLYPTDKLYPHHRSTVCPTIGLTKTSRGWSAVWLKETGAPRLSSYESADEHPSKDQALLSAYRAVLAGRRNGSSQVEQASNNKISATVDVAEAVNISQ